MRIKDVNCYKKKKQTTQNRNRHETKQIKIVMIGFKKQKGKNILITSIHI